MRTWFYDRAGRPLDALSWSLLATDIHYVVVAANFVGRRGYVETRWVGRDQKDAEDGLPLIYVTTVTFDRQQVEQHATPTIGAALTAHRRAARRLRLVGLTGWWR